jgi:hypothetical protein
MFQAQTEFADGQGWRPMRIFSSSAIGYTSIAAALFLVLVVFAKLPAQQELGTVSGTTLFVVKGHPGALMGKPDPNYKAPEPQIAPNEKLFWVRIDRENAHRLFVARSDGQGKFQIDLPPGDYCVEAASMHEVDLRQVPSQQRDNEEVLLKLLFPPWRLEGKPDLKIEKGQTYRMDVEARALFVD